MSRVVYVDGRYRPYGQALVHAEDRGFQFGDAVYEVCEVRRGRLIDEERHVQRLERSLGELGIPEPMSAPALARVMRETIRRNRVHEGMVYLQVSRGAAPRDFLFPSPDTPPTVVCIARAGNTAKADAKAQAGIGVISMPDPRWNRCDIKTVMLLPASLAKEEAKRHGAGEVWFTDRDGFVTEGGSSNAWIITKEGRLVTRPASVALLRGVTRMTLLDVLAAEGIPIDERPFTLEEAKAAREAFVTSATSLVMPVVRIDTAAIGNGEPGSIAQRLRDKFREHTDQKTT